MYLRNLFFHLRSSLYPFYEPLIKSIANSYYRLRFPHYVFYIQNKTLNDIAQLKSLNYKFYYLIYVEIDTNSGSIIYPLRFILSIRCIRKII